MIGRALATPANWAGAAGVSASSTSEHLAVLLDAGLIRCEVKGRQRFYRISTPTIVAALEHIGRLCSDHLAGRRQLTRPCPDWTERRLHLAGALGAAVAALFEERSWTRRRTSGRGLTVTTIGAANLTQRFDIRCSRPPIMRSAMRARCGLP